LYTQCAKCETVFRLSAEVLRAAGGQVRCGRCGEVFNALARLAEDASAFPAGESPLEMEARADEILHSTVPPVGHAASADEDDQDSTSEADVDLARLQVLEKFEDDTAKEPPVQRPAAAPSRASDAFKAAEAAKAAAALKVAAAARAAAAIKAAASRPAASSAGSAPQPQDGARPAGAKSSAAKSADGRNVAPATKPAPPQTTAEESAENGSLEFTLPPGELDRIFIEAPQRPAVPTAPATEVGAEGADHGEAARRVAGLEVSEDVRREMLAGMDEQVLPLQIDTTPRRPLPFALWLGAAAALALLLAVQMIRENRDWLAAHAPLRGPLHGLYAALDIGPPASSTLSAYQLRQWGVTGDPGAAGTLRVRASILNTAAQLQPYPLLRVTLANRFGVRIGARDFEPTEYMGKPTVRMLAPGERADATLDIVDPGKDAEGFEIDVCLRNSDQKISCAGDAAPQIPAKK
jgi:predicted Zn finger-like uncharacterized protein